MVMGWYNSDSSPGKKLLSPTVCVSTRSVMNVGTLLMISYSNWSGCCRLTSGHNWGYHDRGLVPSGSFNCEHAGCRLANLFKPHINCPPQCPHLPALILAVSQRFQLIAARTLHDWRGRQVPAIYSMHNQRPHALNIVIIIIILITCRANKQFLAVVEK